MICSKVIRPRSRPSSGYALLGILFMLTLLIVAMGTAVPAIKAQIQRNREEEMIHRGVQYSRAIKKYFIKFGRYPTSLEQLEDTDHIRFLRKEYKDPMAADGQWRLLHVGDVTLNWKNVETPAPAMGIVPETSRQVEGLPALRESAGDSPFSNGTFAGMTQASSATTTASGAQGAARQTSLGSANNTRPINAGALIGVASTSLKEGMHSFNDQNQYSHWYFVYDPTLDNGALIKRPYSGNTYRSVGVVPQTAGRNIPQPLGDSTEASSTEPSDSPQQ